MRDTWGRDRDDLCQAYDSAASRVCRNKRLVGRYCRKHTVQQLRDFEESNPRLLWYLENRHLLEDS